MRSALKLTVGAVAISLSGAAFAEIPLPSPLPANLAGSAAGSLSSQHDALVGRHDRIEQEIGNQNSQCSAVSPDDEALVATCRDSQQRILAEMGSYQTDLDAYERALRIALADARAPTAQVTPTAQIASTPSKSAQINALCGQLDADLNQLSQVDLKIVQLELDALSKVLVPVPVAVFVPGSDGAGEPKEYGEPPDYVLQEAREALQQVAETSEQIDELNGKRAWTDEQRKWVLEHVFVATPSGNYSVETSEPTAHGQTAFSDLRKMPAFRGCATGSSGQRYIPQYPRSQH